MRRPAVIALSVVALLLFLGAPFLRVSFGLPDDRVLPATASTLNSRSIGARRCTTTEDGSLCSSFIFQPM